MKASLTSASMRPRTWARELIFEGLYRSGYLEIRQARGTDAGVIFMLHRVAEPGKPILAPNLVAKSVFLKRALQHIRDLGWDIVSLDEASRRIECGEGKRFVCFTFDDGYKDTLEIALPLFKQHGAPLCVYVTTGLVDRNAFLWWPVLENLLLARDNVRYVSEGREQQIRTATIEQKRAAYELLFPIIKTNFQAIPFFELNGIDPKATLDTLILTWTDVQKLAAEPLVEIGCHTVTHPELATLSTADAKRELEESRSVLREKTGRRISHVSYPFGTEKECGAREFEIAREMGFRTGTTTRRGHVVPEHKDHLTALPRINVPGSDSASLRFIRKCLFGDSLRLNYATPLVTD